MSGGGEAATAEPSKDRVGLVAGWGEYPLIVAQALRRQGYRVYGVGVRDHANPQLAASCEAYREIGLGQLGAAIRFFRRRGVRRATMAGKIHKVRLFEPGWWRRHLPDWTCARVFFPYFVSQRRPRNDDALLGAIVQACQERGVEMAPATDFAPDLLAPAGPLSRHRPSRAELLDIAFGWRVAKALGRVDVGQTVAVKGRAVLALEAIEGTDACIRRAGQLCPAGGFTVVKTAKPQQDMRFDVPTIGVGTLCALHESGGRVLAVEAGKTILVDRESITRFADAHGLAVVALREADVLRRAA